MVRPALLRLLESYFRHRWLYLLPILVMLAIGVAYVITKPPTYISAGTLRIQKESLLASLTDLRSEGFSYVTPAEETVSELNELVNSNAFIRAVIRNTDLEGQMNDGREAVDRTINEARGAVWTRTLGNNLVLIGSSHEEPEVAFQLVRSTVNTYIGSKINESLTESEAAQAFFTDVIVTYRSDLAPAQRELIDYLTDHPEPIRGERPAIEEAEIARLRADVTDVQERLRNARINEENARLAQAQTESDVRQTYFELDSPSLPTEPSQSLRGMALTLVIFGAIGAFLSLIGVVGGALLDRTFRFPVDVRQSLHLPVLGMVPVSAADVSGRESTAQAAATAWPAAPRAQHPFPWQGAQPSATPQPSSQPGRANQPAGVNGQASANASSFDVQSNVNGLGNAGPNDLGSASTRRARNS